MPCGVVVVKEPVLHDRESGLKQGNSKAAFYTLNTLTRSQQYMATVLYMDQTFLGKNPNPAHKNLFVHGSHINFLKMKTIILQKKNNKKEAMIAKILPSRQFFNATTSNRPRLTSAY